MRQLPQRGFLGNEGEVLRRADELFDGLQVISDASGICVGGSWYVAVDLGASGLGWARVERAVLEAILESVQQETAKVLLGLLSKETPLGLDLLGLAEGMLRRVLLVPAMPVVCSFVLVPWLGCLRAVEPCAVLVLSPHPFGSCWLGVLSVRLSRLLLRRLSLSTTNRRRKEAGREAIHGGTKRTDGVEKGLLAGVRHGVVEAGITATKRKAAMISETRSTRQAPVTLCKAASVLFAKTTLGARLRFRCWFGFRRTEPRDVHSKGEQPVPKQNGKKHSPVRDGPNQARLDGRVPPGKVDSAREGRKEVPNTKG